MHPCSYVQRSPQTQPQQSTTVEARAFERTQRCIRPCFHRGLSDWHPDHDPQHTTAAELFRYVTSTSTGDYGMSGLCSSATALQTAPTLTMAYSTQR
jgi:hypothetical protein